MAESPPSLPPRLAVPALVLANLVLACGPWLVRLARAESGVGPVAAGFWRLALAAPVLLAAARQIERAPPRPRGAVLLAAFAGAFFAADLAFWHVGILHTRLANATLLGNVAALTFPLVGFAIARTWPRRRQAFALALAAAGAVLLLGRSYELSAGNLLGDLACVAAGLFYTGYLVAVERMQGRLGPVTTLAVASAAGAPLLLATALALGEGVWPADWAPLIALTLGSQLLGQGLILFAIGLVPPIVVGLMLLVQPIVAAAFGWFAYGERLEAVDLVGALAIGAAVLLVRERPALSPAAAPLVTP